MNRVEELLEKQIAFYRADAEFYETWHAEVFARGGGGAAGEAYRRDRRRALEELAANAPFGEVLELAAGTGSCTPALVASADHLTVVDASPESLAIARAKLADHAERITWIEADIFGWRPPRRYDTIFFSYWLSHVPSSRFEPFWQLVSEALAPNGRVFLIDSLRAPSDSPLRTWDPSYREQDDLDQQISTRQLHGRLYQVIKVAWRPRDLVQRLTELGWQARLVQGEFSLWGTVWAQVAAAQQAAAADGRATRAG